jgi:hypothetical protein
MGLHRTRGGHGPRPRPSGQPTSPTLWQQHKGGTKEEYSEIIDVVHGRMVITLPTWQPPDLPPQCKLHVQHVGTDLWCL